MGRASFHGNYQETRPTGNDSFAAAGGVLRCSAGPVLQFAEEQLRIGPTCTQPPKRWSGSSDHRSVGMRRQVDGDQS
jgi:hypothetical protein